MSPCFIVIVTALGSHISSPECAKTRDFLFSFLLIFVQVFELHFTSMSLGSEFLLLIVMQHDTGYEKV